MKTKHAVAVAASALAIVATLTACKDNPPPPPSTPDAAAAGASNDAIPVAEDYEAEAEQAVTPENVDTELTKLEAEVDSDVAP